jgi:hypothetical protein
LHMWRIKRAHNIDVGMAEGMFAGAVMLGGLDDFVTPSQACVNPLFASSVNGVALDSAGTDLDAGVVVYVSVYDD